MGRARDIIIVAGTNIHPGDLEVHAARRAGIDRNRIAIFGSPGRLGTNDIHVVIEARAADELPGIGPIVADACYEACGVLPATVRVVPIGSIPRTTSDKIQRSRLREAFEIGTALSFGVDVSNQDDNRADHA